MVKKSRKKANKNLYYGIGGIGIMVLMVAVVFLAVSPQSPFVVSPEEVPVGTGSTFSLTSYVDGEDVSNFVEISIWTPKSDAEFDDTEDIYTMSNFEETETSKDADDIDIDLSSYTYVWIEIDPDAETVFETTWTMIFGGVNYAYSMYVYHQSSDVNFNVLTASTMSAIAVGDYNADVDLLIIMDVPHSTSSNLHYGANWDLTTEEYNELEADELEALKDEKNYRCQAPTYNPADDDEKDFDDDLEKITDAFALRMTYNDTISTVDGNGNQVNCTVDSNDEPIEVIISGTYIFLVFYEIISFEDGSYDFVIELEIGADIHLDNVQSGRLEVPRDDDNLGTFTVLSAIGA